jgi:PaREP6 domain containing protein
MISKGIEKWKKLEEEAREIRRSEADWNFIESQPPKIRAALKFYVETGDLYVASRIADMSIEEFNDLRKRAGIPNVC